MICRISFIVFCCFSCQAATFDPFSGTMEKMFHIINPGNEGGLSEDTHLQVKDGKIVIADFQHGLVSLLSLNDRRVIGSLRLPEMSFGTLGTAMMNDGTVAVSGESKGSGAIFILDVSGDEPVIARKVPTSADLDNGVIANGPLNNIALVTNDGRVDVVSLEDGTVQTLAKGVGVSVRMSATRYGDNLYISNWYGLDIVNINNGERTYDIGSLALSTLSNMSLGQTAFDQAGNMYVCAIGEMCAEDADPPCVLVISPTGTWRKLADGPEMSDPKGIAVTSSGFVVTWQEAFPSNRSVLEVYNVL